MRTCTNEADPRRSSGGGSVKLRTAANAHQLYHAAAGKQLAMYLYSIGGRDLRDTQLAFDRRPEWWAA